MPKNLPGWEQGLRVFCGAALVALAIIMFPDAWQRYVLACVGITIIATGAIAFCPMCAAAGRRHLDMR